MNNAGFVVIIPARHGASRLPGKPLRMIAGRPMIAHVAQRALAAGADAVVVATEHPQIAEAAEAAGCQVCMTRSDHVSGSDRLAEAVAQLQLSDECIVVNLQGDEPEMPASCLRAVARCLEASNAPMATLATHIDDPAQLLDPDCVKVVLDAQGRALYFSRAPIPWNRQQPVSRESSTVQAALRHIGLYAYRAEALRRFAAMPAGNLEQLEMLEQLRALEAGWPIAVSLAPEAVPPGIDTEADLQALIRRWEAC